MTSQGATVTIATGYGQNDREVGVRIAMVQEFPLLQIVQTGFDVHQLPVQ
jgi:hypothetical protein